MNYPFLTIRATKSVTTILFFNPQNNTYLINELKSSNEEQLPMTLQRIKDSLTNIINNNNIETIYIKDITPGSLGIDPERYMIHGVLIQVSYEAGVKNIFFRKKSTIKSLFQNNKKYVEIFGKDYKFDLDIYSKNAIEFKKFCETMFPNLNIENIKNNNTRETVMTSLCSFLEKMDSISVEKKKRLSIKK